MTPDVAALFTLHRAELYRFVRRQVDSHETAEDVVAETFVRALSGPYQDRGEARAWLYRLARNLVIDHYRREGAQRRAYERLGVRRVTADAGSDRHVDALTVAWALDRLTPGQRRATVACDLDGSTNGEVAATWGSTPNTVKKYRYWARIRLRQHLGVAS